MSAADSPLTHHTPLDVLTARREGERKFGYTKEGKKKRILLNAFDMNGVGHIR